mmetsp:Transcript_29370/g.87057  ORF Transcript_29370/g.87057 Transcript_29370/m.87057 type:complete len:240 (+) Transcript_29370:1753-2472(+)
MRVGWIRTECCWGSRSEKTTEGMTVGKSPTEPRTPLGHWTESSIPTVGTTSSEIATERRTARAMGRTMGPTMEHTMASTKGTRMELGRENRWESPMVPPKASRSECPMVLRTDPPTDETTARRSARRWDDPIRTRTDRSTARPTNWASTTRWDGCWARPSRTVASTSKASRSARGTGRTYGPTTEIPTAYRLEPGTDRSWETTTAHRTFATTVHLSGRTKRWAEPIQWEYRWVRTTTTA